MPRRSPVVFRCSFRSGILISAVPLAVMTIMASCRFSYDGVETGEDTAERKVSFVLQNSRYTVHNADETAVKFEAETLSFFEDEQTAELEHFKFQFTENGGAVTVAEGSAERASIAMDTEDVQLEGNIQLEFTGEEAEIAAADLFWDNSERTLSSDPGSVVTVLQSDGTMVSGDGFTAHVYQRTFSFSGQTEGTLIDSGNGSSGQPADRK